jgi:hypothetical protein
LLGLAGWLDATAVTFHAQTVFSSGFDPTWQSKKRMCVNVVVVEGSRHYNANAATARMNIQPLLDCLDRTFCRRCSFGIEIRGVRVVPAAFYGFDPGGGPGGDVANRRMSEVWRAAGSVATCAGRISSAISRVRRVSRVR